MRRRCTESLCAYSGRSVRQAVVADKGSRTEAHRESGGIATGPYRPRTAARLAATSGVIGQKSAEAIVAAVSKGGSR